MVNQMSLNPSAPSYESLEIPDQARGGIISIGNFDGVHEGHKNLIVQMKNHGSTLFKNPVPVVAITFSPHPLSILKPEIKLDFLSTTPQKKKLLESAGIDFVAILKTEDGLLDLEAKEFFEKIIVEKFRARGIVEGADFHFGKNRIGNIQLLQNLCHDKNIEFKTALPYQMDGELVSSSKVRKAIHAGDMDQARKLLGRYYSIDGKVVTGAQRGRTIGFPTANLENIQTILPENGVYAAFCRLNAKTYACAVNIGPNPTFSESSKKFEAHLINFSGDLYGQNLEIHFIKKIRSIKTFADKKELTEQLKLDVTQTMNLAEKKLETE